jgi:hypothetical protein
MPEPIIGHELFTVEPRADFNPDEFRAQIQGWGHRMRWERALRCPGSQVYVDGQDATFQARVRSCRRGCPDCDGSGYLLTAAQDCKALVNDASADKKFLQTFGEMAFGAVRLSLLPEHLPGWRDRFTDMDGARLYQEPPRIRKANVEYLTYPILTRSMLVGTAGNPTNPLRREIGVALIRRASVAGISLPGELVIGVDFRITPEGAIEWLDGGNPPALGESYSVLYTCRPVYIVRTQPHLYRHTYVAVRPFLNAYDGFKGYWNPSSGLPSGSGVARGDYFEVGQSGTAEGVAFVRDDLLAALVDSPSTLPDWVRIPAEGTTVGEVAELVPMTVMVTAWLEDLGDPFNRVGLP